MINEYLFCKAINELKTTTDYERNLRKLIRDSFEGTDVSYDFIGEGSYVIVHDQLVIDLLERAFNDDGGFISWWCYETDFGRCDDEFKTVTLTEDNKSVIINTPEDLYEFITKYYC